MIRFLYSIALLELFIGGGGRLLSVGPVSARMVLFGPCVFIGISALLANRRISRSQLLAVGLVLDYLAIHLPGIINGAIHGQDMADIFKEFQQSLFWLAAPFFAMVVQSDEMVSYSARLVRLGCLVLAFGYLGVLACGALGLVDVFALYMRVDETGEFAGRGEGLFFYKGFLYLGIGLVFLVAMREKYWLPLSVIVLVALVATLTRGFILSTSIAILLLLFVQGRRGATTLAVVLALTALFVVLVYLPSLNDKILTAQGASSSQRVEDTVFMASHATASTFMFGEGFGALINDRAIIENTFLWVTWKLGFSGLIFWFVPLLLCAHYFFSIPNRGKNRLACAYFFGTVLVYVQTMTNPYLNNPIGLSFVILALFSLRQLAESATGRMTPAGRRPAAPTKLSANSSQSPIGVPQTR